MGSIFSLSLLLLAVSSSFFSAVSRKQLRNKEFGGTELSRTAHSIRVNPSRVVQLSWRPRVFLYEGFLSDEECDQLISSAHKLDEKASTDSGDTARNWHVELSESRKLKEDDMVLRIEERISAWTFLPKEDGKVLKVLHYRNEDYEESLSYLGNRSSVEEREDETNPLIATVVLYLSNVNRGGQILFPNSEVKDQIWSSDCENSSSEILRPKKGNAVLFFHRHHDTTPDEASAHIRCPVPKDDMWWATKSFRIKVEGQEKNVRSSDDHLCSDEDNNCPKWAAAGECERNPVFMIGSEDYFGTCRFSCNVC